jgi:cystathionine beta-lyase
MKYDFDKTIVRLGTGCYKWDLETSCSTEDGAYSDIIPMWVADMDFQTAPAIIHRLQERVAHGVFGYTLVPESYYEAVISWFSRRHKWAVERSWIQYTSGVVPALSVVVKAFTEPGDQVILQTPVYNCFFSSVRNNGCEVVENRLTVSNGHYTIDFDDLERKTSHPNAKLLILCNPHNPSGRVWTRMELQRIDEICKKNHVIVVSDEIHNELTYRGCRYVPFGTVGMDNAIICTSPSKSFNTAGLQIANIICSHPDWQAKIDRAININEVCDVNPFGVVALQAAYNESEEWLDELCEYIWQNYEALCDFFLRELPQLTVTPLEGTYLVWVDIRSTGLSSDELTRQLLHKGKVRVNAGTMYGVTSPDGDNAGEGFIRLNIACPRSQMMEGLRRIKETIDQAR